MTDTSTPKRTITVKTILAWVVAIFTLFLSLIFLLMSAPTGALITFIASVFILPPTYNFLSKKMNIHLSRALRVVVFVCLFFLGFIVTVFTSNVPDEQDSNRTENKAKIETKQTEEIVDDTNDKEEKEVQPESIAEKTYAIGEEVVVKDVTWKLLSAQDLGETLLARDSKYASIASSKTTTGKYVKVEYEVTHNSSSTKSISDPNLLDDAGRQYTSPSDVYEWIPEGKELIFSNLNSGITYTFVTIYEVPKDAKNLAFEATDLELFGSKTEEIQLGF
ncbi:MAG: hypothetical protein Q8P90_04780 [bacterium]|nr:hypothetical protein [bacterium]